jgi:hypothetical protein
MDMICVDISEVPNAKLFDEVILLGDKATTLRANSIAGLYGGSVYELLCQLGRRAKRYYYYGKKLVDDEPILRRSFIPTDFNSLKLNSVIQHALAHRIQNDEVSSAIYQDILDSVFADTDNDIAYRSDFIHHITFADSLDKDFYKVKTSLSYYKTLKNEEFIIVCANSSEKLLKFFNRKDCEYRWLLDKNLSNDMFAITNMSVNDYNLSFEPMTIAHCLVYKFNDYCLKKLVGKTVKFSLETETLYPKNSHQLSVYINEITKGVSVSFTFPSELKVETTVVFSGKERFPLITKAKNTISIKTKNDTWVFPSSGIVFSF